MKDFHTYEKQKVKVWFYIFFGVEHQNVILNLICFDYVNNNIFYSSFPVVEHSYFLTSVSCLLINLCKVFLHSFSDFPTAATILYKYDPAVDYQSSLL